MTVIILRARKPVDAFTIQDSLSKMGITTKNLEAGGGSWVETKRRLFRVTDKGLEGVGPSDIVVADPSISLDTFPEGFSFGNGVTVSGGIVWIVIDPALKDKILSRLDDIRKLLG